MGVLSVSGQLGSEDGPGLEPKESPDVDTEETPEPEPETPPAHDGTERPTKPDFVPWSAVQPKTPGSRRQKAEQALDEKIKKQFDSLRAEQAQERERYEQRIQQQQQELAHMRGGMEALQRQPQRQEPPGADPTELRRKAREALDNKDFDTYDRLTWEAIDATADRKADQRARAAYEAASRQIPQQVPPEVQYLINQHRNVALAGEEGLRTVLLKDSEMEIVYRMPRSPERLEKAFELADKALAARRNPQQQRKSNGYDPSAADALSAVPTGRNGGGGDKADEDGVTLTAQQKQVAKDLGWDSTTYAKWLSPDKWLKR